jgi:hypothetical protein
MVQTMHTAQYLAMENSDVTDVLDASQDKRLQRC